MTDIPLAGGRWITRPGGIRDWRPAPASKTDTTKPRPTAPLPRLQLREHWSTIAATVAEYFGVDLCDLARPVGGRQAPTALLDARHISRWLVRQTGMSYPKIAEHFQCHHTTVLSSVRLVDSSPALQLHVLEVLAVLRDARTTVTEVA